MFDLSCDDGNVFDGDGCSGRCEVEDGWECTRGSPSVCVLVGGLEIEVKRQEKVAGRNRVYLYVWLSVGLRLGRENFLFKYLNISGNPLETTAIDLKNYKLLIEYTQIVQNTQAQLQIALFKPSPSRRLLTQQVNYLNFSFPL